MAFQPLRVQIENTPRQFVKFFNGILSGMNNCCVCVKESRVRDTSLDLDLRDAVAKGKRERQAVLQQVRQRRALIMRRLTATGGGSRVVPRSTVGRQRVPRPTRIGVDTRMHTPYNQPHGQSRSRHDDCPKTRGSGAGAAQEAQGRGQDSRA
jgi:hypothetical protein